MSKYFSVVLYSSKDDLSHYIITDFENELKKQKQKKHIKKNYSNYIYLVKIGSKLNVLICSLRPNN